MTRALFVIIIILFGVINLSAQDETSAENCIVIMGDSLPAGTFVAELPGTGMTVLQTERVSYLLDTALREAQLLHYGIYDLSLAASAITDINAEPYLTSREFFLGRSLNCRYVLIFPFLNDLYTSDDGETGLAIYQAGLTTMLDSIRSHSPDSHIVLMNFYAVTLQGAGDATYGDDVSLEHVNAMNAIHNEACTEDLKITCLGLNQFLIPIEDYVIRQISRQEYETLAYEVLNPNDEDMVERYWANTPNNDILGDGLHLNRAGQEYLVRALMELFAQIDPVNFAPILR